MTLLDGLRERFPGADTPWARFDGPAGSLPVDTAIEATTEWQRSAAPANTGGAFSMSRACGELVESARTSAALLIGSQPESLVWGPSATALIMNLAAAVAADLEPGDEIVCTELDHEANVAPWVRVAAWRGASIRVARVDRRTGRLDPEAVAAELTDRTRWVALTGASNVLGTIPDLETITTMTHDAGARIVVDGVHLTPHQPVDVASIGCDVYATSAYKWFGPHMSAMHAAPDLLDELDRLVMRGGPTEGPSRFEMGTPPFELLAGVLAAADFLTEIGVSRLSEHESTIFAPLLAGLRGMGHVTTYGPDTLDHRTPTVYFTVAGRESGDVATTLAERSIAVWSGHNYGFGAVAAQGLDPDVGGVRAGISPYTTLDDVDRLLTAVADLADT